MNSSINSLMNISRRNMSPPQAAPPGFQPAAFVPAAGGLAAGFQTGFQAPPRAPPRPKPTSPAALESAKAQSLINDFLIKREDDEEDAKNMVQMLRTIGKMDDGAKKKFLSMLKKETSVDKNVVNRLPDQETPALARRLQEMAKLDLSQFTNQGLKSLLTKSSLDLRKLRPVPRFKSSNFRPAPNPFNDGRREAGKKRKRGTSSGGRSGGPKVKR